MFDGEDSEVPHSCRYGRSNWSKRGRPPDPAEVQVPDTSKHYRSPVQHEEPLCR